MEILGWRKKHPRWQLNTNQALVAGFLHPVTVWKKKIYSMCLYIIYIYINIYYSAGPSKLGDQIFPKEFDSLVWWKFQKDGWNHHPDLYYINYIQKNALLRRPAKSKGSPEIMEGGRCNFFLMKKATVLLTAEIPIPTTWDGAETLLIMGFQLPTSTGAGQEFRLPSTVVTRFSSSK